MPTKFSKIMLVTNEPANSTGAEQTAVNLAKAHDASLLLVDSIRTPFHAPRYPSLKTELMYEVALNSKNVYLAKLQTALAQEGIRTTTKVLFGPRTSSELIRTAIDQDCNLVVRYLKGQSSRSKGRFGETAANLLRACPMPVLLVEKAINEPKVAAFVNLDHGPEENQAIIENARRLVSSPENLFIVSCWEFTGNEFLLDYMDEGMHEQNKGEAAEIYQRLFERLQSDYAIEDFGDRVRLLAANPTTAIPQFCLENRIDVAVMCSASLNHPLGRKLGSTIERTIGELPCGLLAVKPIGFRTEVSNSISDSSILEAQA